MKNAQIKDVAKRENSHINDITEESLGAKQGRYVYRDSFKLPYHLLVTLMGHSTKGINEEASADNFRKKTFYI